MVFMLTHILILHDLIGLSLPLIHHPPNPNDVIGYLFHSDSTHLTPMITPMLKLFDYADYGIN